MSPATEAVRAFANVKKGDAFVPNPVSEPAAVVNTSPVVDASFTYQVVAKLESNTNIANKVAITLNLSALQHSNSNNKNLLKFKKKINVSKI